MTELDNRTDEDLIAGIIQRDQMALAALYERHSRAVYNLANVVVRNASIAEELTQDVFMLLWRSPEKWNPDKGRLSSWMLAVTRYMAIDRIRKEEREPVSAASSLTTQEDFLSVTVSPTAEDDARLMKSILQRLPVEQRQVVLLAYYRGMTHREIAGHLNQPEGTIKSRLRLGLQKVREMWQTAVTELEEL